MKKWICVSVLTLLISFSAIAQSISPNALGIRLESGDRLGTEISYQRALGDNNRLELNLGIRESGFVDIIQLTGLYEWVWNISGSLNWYAGAGGAVGIVDFDDNHPLQSNPDFEDDNSVYLTIDGIVGLEYSFADFGVPIMIALDLNPDIELINEHYEDDFLSLAFAIRVQF